MSNERINSKTSVHAFEELADKIAQYHKKRERQDDSIRVDPQLLMPSDKDGAVLIPRFFKIRDITLDRARIIVTNGETIVRLTPTEYRLFNFLSVHSGRTVLFDEFRTVIAWRYYGVDRVDLPDRLKVHVSRLQSKLGATSEDRIIKSVRGFGYTL